MPLHKRSRSNRSSASNADLLGEVRMYRRSLAGVALVGVIALGAVACTSKSKSPSPNASGSRTAPATSSAPTTAATSAAASGSAVAAGSAAHGGLTLADSAPLSTTQGTKAITVENNPIPTLEDQFNAFDSNGFGYKL